MTDWDNGYLPDPKENIDQLQELFIGELYMAANGSMPLKKAPASNHKDAWYYNPRIKEMNKRVNRVRKLFRRHRTDELYRTLLQVTEHAVAVSTEVKQQKWLEWCSGLNGFTSLRRIWSFFNKVVGKNRTNKTAHPDPPAEANRIAQGFADRAKSINLPLPTRRRQEELLPIRSTMINAACDMADNTDTPFTKEELERAFAKTKNTAPGIDGITYSMLRNMGAPAQGFYLRLINKTYVERCRPLTWNQQNIQPVPKPQEENAYQPIALISCTEKVAERMVLNRLKWKVGKLHPRLYGFTEGIGSHECIVDALAAVNNGRALINFIDLEKAYELANAKPFFLPW
ncbi:uncharacterized protein [Palaemon carinicauda]|uniref:uncharacterized protein n=1 Tax=Palaemon carinicauda TaxID=392227 RepID=UPI0035B65D82